MSRAVNIAADQDEVKAVCAKNNATISAIETLISGGTRVVLMNSDDAELIRKRFKSRIVAGSVIRTRWVRNS